MNDKPRRTTFRQRYDEMLATLKNEIITEVWKEGSYLPSEYDIADRFQLSKNSVRKGLDVLASEGFIEKMPRIGNCVLKPPAGVTIKFGYYPSLIQEANLNMLLDEFHKKHPLIRITLIPIPYNHAKPSLRDYMESDDIDVMSINNQNFDLFLDSEGSPELLEPLTIGDGIYPILTKPFTRQGQTYVYPFTFSPVILCYNKQHFAENNVSEPDSSWTWDTIKKAAGQLSSGKDRYGFFFHFLSDNRWPIFFLQNNVVFNRGNEAGGGKLELDEAALKESLQLLMDLNEEVFPPFISEDDQDAEMLFMQQKVSMILTSYFFLNMIKDVDFPYDISPLPYLKNPKTLLIVIGLGINKFSKHKQAAQTFIDFMVSHDAQLLLRQHTLSIPSLKSAAEWDEQGGLKQPSRYFVYRETFPTFSYHNDMNVRFSDLDVIRRQMKMYFSNLAGLEVFV